MTRTRLWHFRVSHYNEKVCWALDHKRWPHVRRALVPAFHVLETRLRSGQNQLPMIEIDGKLLAGSSQILAEIERLRPDPPLYPSNAADRERALAIQSFFDEQVAPDVRRLFWSAYLDRPDDCVRMVTDGFSAGTRRTFRTLFPLLRPLFRRNMGVGARDLHGIRGRLAGYFDRIESEIGPSGYLVGDRFSVADLAVAAVMTAIIRPPQFPYPLPEPWPPALMEIRQSIAARPGCRWVLDIYTKHRDPSAEVAQ